MIRAKLTLLATGLLAAGILSPASFNALTTKVQSPSTSVLLNQITKKLSKIQAQLQHAPSTSVSAQLKTVEHMALMIHSGSLRASEKSQWQRDVSLLHSLAQTHATQSAAPQVSRATASPAMAHTSSHATHHARATTTTTPLNALGIRVQHWLEVHRGDTGTQALQRISLLRSQGKTWQQIAALIIGTANNTPRTALAHSQSVVHVSAYTEGQTTSHLKPQQSHAAPLTQTTHASSTVSLNLGL